MAVQLLQLLRVNLQAAEAQKRPIVPEGSALASRIKAFTYVRTPLLLAVVCVDVFPMLVWC
jgi:hypothetical protein